MCFLCVYTGCWWIVTGEITIRLGWFIDVTFVFWLFEKWVCKFGKGTSTAVPTIGRLRQCYVVCRRHQITTRNSKNNILHGVTLLILISGDIAENPGPIKFPCGSCAKPVKKNQKGIQCEDCLFWYHIKCINLPVTYYITLSESSDSWYCSRCTLPEFTDSFFEKSKNESDIDKSTESDGLKSFWAESECNGNKYQSPH
jgi:hypothetical protein